MPNPDIDKIINKDTNDEYLLEDSTARGDIQSITSDLGDKMDKANPTGSGALSINRKQNTTVGDYSTAVGFNNTASEYGSFAAGIGNKATGYGSVAEGTNTEASGTHAHTEGDHTQAVGDYSHSEGYYTEASGDYSHAEGGYTTSSGFNSHAEGADTVASGDRSHAEGEGTEAASDNQHVSGKYNVVDNADTYAEIIGNGADENNRSNARTLDWSGNETIAGDLFFNGGQNGLTSQLSGKQDTLTAGSNIQINGATISATDTKPTDYSTTGDKTDNVATGASWSIFSSVQITRGLWLINYGANFPSLGSGNTGHVGVGVSDSSTATTAPAVNMRLTSQRITQDNYTSLSSACLYECTTDTKTLYLKVRQTSGQTLSVEGKLRVVKIL